MSGRAIVTELAVPATNRRMVEKAVASAADAIFLDLEDAVAPSAKQAARVAVIDALTGLDWGGKPRSYRVNAVDTPYCYRDLVDIVEAAPNAIDRIVVPKVSSVADVHYLDILLTQLESSVGRSVPIRLEIQIENARGLRDCDQIAAAAPRIETITFGPGDFAASVGMPAAMIGVADAADAAYPGHRYHYAMSSILVAGRAAGLSVLDGPSAEFRDLDALRRSCEIARALGYDGKWCIHPAQIPVVQEAFAPTDAEIAHATALVTAYKSALAQGEGAVSFSGQMIDAASLRMAQRTLAKRRT